MGPRPGGRGRRRVRRAGPKRSTPSMGPRPGGRGRWRKVGVIETQTLPSMGPRPGGRGRQASRAEYAIIGRPSMGPRPGGRGRHYGPYDIAFYEDPSMGPRPGGRGRSAWGFNMHGSSGSFNGATSRRTWKAVRYARATCRPASFNGATSRRTWKVRPLQVLCITQLRCTVSSTGRGTAAERIHGEARNPRSRLSKNLGLRALPRDRAVTGALAGPDDREEWGMLFR